MKTKIVIAVTAMALLGACEARIGRDDKAGASERAQAAAGGAEEGTFSIDAPGFDLKINIPEGMKDGMVNSDSEILYPGAQLSGMHVNADGQGNARDKVELRFTSADAPDKVAAWYRDGARAETFAIASAVEKNGTYTLSGTEVEDGDPFTLQLARRGEGTDARLTLQDKN